MNEGKALDEMRHDERRTFDWHATHFRHFSWIGRPFFPCLSTHSHHSSISHFHLKILFKKFPKMFLAISALSMPFLLLLLLKLASNVVECHNFSPLVPARHFNERLLEDVSPPVIKIVTKNGTKELKPFEEKGKTVYRWVLMKNPSPQPSPAQQQPTQTKPAAAPAAAAPAAAQPTGPIFVFDPPTRGEQEEFQDKLIASQNFHGRVPKDVYFGYHQLVNKSDDNKKIIPSKTIPAKVVSIQRNDNKENNNNLYRALAYAMAGTELLHKGTRLAVLTYFESFFGHWDKKQAQPWIDEFEVKSVRRQTEKIRTGKSGGTVELVAAAKKFNMNVLIYKTDKDMWLCISPKTMHRWDLDKSCQSKDTMTIALEMYDNENYDVILDVTQKK